MRYVVCFLLLLAWTGVMSCSKSTPEAEEAEEVEGGEGLRKADPKYQALAEKFGRAFMDKDYRGGYDLMSPEFQNQVPYSEYEEGVKPYRDAFEGAIEAGYVASDDPQEMSEFVAETERRYLVEEITIDFTGQIEGEEGSFFCTLWIIDDGTPRIGRFYLED